MRIAGFLLLLAGFAIALAAIILLTPVLSRASFILAGVAVEALGLGLVIRSYPITPGRDN